MNTEQLEKNLSRTHEWIKLADQKVSIFLAVESLLVNLIFWKYYSWLKLNFCDLSDFTIVLMIFGVVLLVYSAVKLLLALLSRLRCEIKTSSLIFFGNIAGYEFTTYKKKVKSLTHDRYNQDLIEQNWISAKIANSKHRIFREATVLFFIGVIFLLISLACEIGVKWL